MFKVGNFFYRFRGYVLGVLALLLFLFPPNRLPQSFSSIDFGLCVLWFAVFLFYLFGITLRVYARRYIGEHTRGKVHDAEILVNQGPYSYIRHPLYVSNFMIACGIILFHLGLSIATFVFIFVVVFFEIFLSYREDLFLEYRFGEQWREWSKNTSAFWVRKHCLCEKKNKDTPKRSIWCAFKADASTWVWLLIVNFLVVMLKLL